MSEKERETTLQTFDRVPPHSIEVEQAVIGAILLDTKALRKSDLQPGHFYKEAHRKIFKAMQDLRHAGEPIDLISLTDYLIKKEQLEVIGGASYLSLIINSIPTSANIVAHSKIVKEKAHRRKIIKDCYDVAARAYGDTSVDELKHRLKQTIRDTRGKTKIISAREVSKITLKCVDKIIDDGNQITGLPSGFIDIDEHTCGWQPGDFIVLAGRPGMGKSAFAGNCTLHAASNNYPIGSFSLEMSEIQSGTRHISELGNIPLKKIRKGDIAVYYKSLTEAVGRLAELPIYYCFDGYMTIDMLWDHVETMVDEYGIKMVVIDYLQLIQSMSRSNNREQQISEISRTLKQIAKTFKIPVMCLAQLNRNCETRTNKRPVLPDLRESGSLEQDADIVIFLYRDDYYYSKKTEKGKEVKKGVAEVIFAKGRQFETGIKELAWQEEMTRFRNLVR